MTIGTGVSWESRKRSENAKRTYIDISFPNFDIFAEIVLFLSISKSLSLSGINDVPRTETLKEEVSGPTVNVRVSFLPISANTPREERITYHSGSIPFP
jgi:hypothetical protein